MATAAAASGAVVDDGDADVTLCQFSVTDEFVKSVFTFLLSFSDSTLSVRSVTGRVYRFPPVKTCLTYAHCKGSLTWNWWRMKSNGNRIIRGVAARRSGIVVGLDQRG